ncbi:BIRC7_8 [Mytilus edulis]|uniref:BIRC7_8 n=1 Tax=Mytilus edulis TaxID=6550 RepID=A0A8S3UGZ2_MYTED|nr:BIRC7_8 [Mytilus edulis]
MTVPINDGDLETGQEDNVTYKDDNNADAQHDQYTDDEKSQTSISNNTENSVVKHKTIKSNYAVLVTIIAGVMAIVKTIQREFVDIFEKIWIVETIPACGGAHSSAGACGNATDAENLSVVSDKHCESVEEQRVNAARVYNENPLTVGRNNENTAQVDRNHEHIVTVERNLASTRNSEITGNLVNNVTDRQRESVSSSHIGTNQTQNIYSRNNTTGLIRIPDTNVVPQRTLTPTVKNSARSSASNSAPMNIGICLEKPKYPKYAIKTTRFSSFTNWPTCLSQTPEDLVNAGFFYTGTEDHCRCFFCGGGLRRWEEGDLPWTEHARWYPKCPFVIQCKGEKFIEDVQKGQNPEIIENLAENKQKKSPLGINGFKNNPSVQTILDFGYESDVVKAAYTRLKESGIHDISASLLLDTIYEKAESENHNATSDQAIACPNSIPVKEPDDKEHSNKTQENIEKIDPTLELSIRSLEEENRNLKDQQTCKICLDEPVAIVFLPCGHMAACINCAPALRRCPICRAFIKGTVKAIMC